MQKRIRVEFDNSIYDCNLRLKDANGVQDFYIPLASNETETPYAVELQIVGDEFDLSFVPAEMDINAQMKEVRSEISQDGWKGKLVYGFLSKALSVLEDLCLRVGCRYRVNDIPDGAVLNARFEGYAVGSKMLCDFFDIFPVIYMYFELSFEERVFELANAWALNRKEIISSARKLALLQIGAEDIIMYPLQVSRAKRLTKDKKVYKTLKSLCILTPEQRQQKRAKWD